MKANWFNLYKINVFGDLFIFKNMNSLMLRNINLNFWIWSLFGIIPSIGFYITSIIDKSTYLEGNRGLIQDYIFLTYFIFIPLIISLAITFFPEITNILHNLKEICITKEINLNKVENINNYISPTIFNEMLLECEKMILGKEKYKYIKLIFILGGFGWVFLSAKSHWFAFDTYNMDIWSSKNFITSFIFRSIYELIVFGFVFPLILYKYIMIMHSIKTFCKKLTEMKVIRLRPLNPDKAGGLGNLGKYSLKMTLLLIPPLAPIFAYIFFGNVNILFLIGISLYIPLLTFAFFYPLSGAHDAMKKYKERELRILSEKFSEIYDGFISQIQTSDKVQILAHLEMFEKLNNIYEKVEKMPLWPFDTNTIAKFGSILAAIISSIWLNWLFGKFVQLQ